MTEKEKLLRKELMADIADHFINIDILTKDSKKFFKLAELKLNSDEYVPVLVFPLYYLKADFSTKAERIKNTKFIFEIVQTLSIAKNYQFKRILFLTEKLTIKKLHWNLISYDINIPKDSLEVEYLAKFNTFQTPSWQLIHGIK